MAVNGFPGREARQFATTHWSLVVAAGDSAHPRCRDALSELCGLYWMPVRSFVRRRVGDDATADDITQGFFASLLERGGLAAADRDRGRFRAFLLTGVRYYLADQYDRSRAKKRGGGQAPLSIDAPMDEGGIDPVDARLTPDREYDRQWAVALLDLVRRRLDHAMDEEKEPARMRRLTGLLTDGDAKYKDVAKELGMSESAVKVAVHRLRKRYAAILREEVSRTVASPDGVDEEIRFLLAAVAG